MTFGEKLFQLRTEQGMSQKTLADKAGLAQTAIGHWETGERDPSWESVTKLCAALSVDCTVFQGCEPGGTKEKRTPGRPPVQQPETPPKADKPPKGKKG